MHIVLTIVVFLSILILATYLNILNKKIKAKNEKKEEKFVNNTPAENKNNENIAYISNGLTIYYSVFSDTSYNIDSGNQGDLKKWYNISQYFKQNDGTTCSLMKYNDSHMMFFNTPKYSRQDGIMLGNNYITGPMSYTLGIASNTQYSMFVLLKFMSISPSTNDIEIFQIFGNTQNLNGIRLFFTGNNTDTVSKDISGGNLYLQIGSNEPLKCTRDGKHNIMFQHNKPYLLIMTNNNSNIKLSLYEGIKENKVDLINSPVSSQMYDVSFSNKNMLINQNQNINGNIFSFGVYNRILGDNDMINLQTHLFSLIQTEDAMIKEKDAEINNMKNEIENMKMCPYDQTTCSQCKSITDWSNINAILTTRDEACLNAINQYCMNNPAHHLCKCWNSNDSSYTSNQCTNFRNIFTNSSCADINNLSAIQISNVKSKYSLCGCQEETVNLQPLKIPEISKFMIPQSTINNIENQSCPSDAKTTSNDPVVTSPILNGNQFNQTNNTTYAQRKKVRKIPDYFSDFDTKPSNKPLSSLDDTPTLKQFWN